MILSIQCIATQNCKINAAQWISFPYSRGPTWRKVKMTPSSGGSSSWPETFKPYCSADILWCWVSCETTDLIPPQQDENLSANSGTDYLYYEGSLPNKLLIEVDQHLKI